MTYFAHESAFIDAGCEIGPGSRIWHFCHISSGARLGEACNLGQNVFIAGGVIIGDRVKIQNNVSIYAGTTLEDEVFLGPSCVLTNISNPRSQIKRQHLYEKTLLRRGATIGANATLVCGIEIGRYAFVAAGAVVTQDAPDYALMMGVPARQQGWMSRHGHVLHFEASDDTFVASCPESGFRYQLENDCVRCLDLPEEQSLPEELSAGQKSYPDFKAQHPDSNSEN